MKKVTLTSKLSLNKETIAKLNDAQMSFVKGGELQIPQDDRSHRSHCAKRPCTMGA